MNHLRKLSIVCLFMCVFLCVTIQESGAVVLHQEGINVNVNLSDNFGTDPTSNPYIGLNFNVTGGITYGYSLNYNLTFGLLEIKMKRWGYQKQIM